MSNNDLSVGTTEWAGTSITNSKEDNTFRIAFQNVNSLGTSQYTHNIQEIATTQQELQIDYVGITEHCLNLSQPKIRNTIQKSLNRHFLGQFALQMNSSTMNTVSPYLPGGTAALIMGDHITRIDPGGRGGDDKGRWSFFTLRRKKLPPLTIYTVYKVNHHPTNEIGNSAWHQQRLLLDQQNRSDEHPREAFTTDLIQSIKQHQHLLHHIIVGGDFNDTLYTNRSQLLRMANATNLIDPWTFLYPQFESFNTYQRGRSRIDSVFISHDLVDSVRHMGYSPFNWFTTSDHRCLVIDFDTSVLFKDTINILHQPQLRGIKSNDKQQVNTFITQCHAHLSSNGVFDHLIDLKDRILNPTQVERIDALLGQAFSSAERRCYRRRSPFYTVKLAQLRTLKSIALGNYNSIKHNNSKTYIFQQRITRHGIDYTLADTLQQSWEQYKSLSAELQALLKSQRELRQQEQHTLIDIASASGNKSKEKIIRNIAKQEAQRHTWQTLRYIRMQTGATQKLDRIEIPSSWPAPFTKVTDVNILEDPKNCNQWTTITEPKQIEFYLQLRNRSHFGQADGTPFTREPLSTLIPWSADTAYCDRLLTGIQTIDFDDVPQLSALLQTCKAASDLDVLPATISYQEFRGKITTWKESTSTSPSGRHLGYYRSLFAPGPFNKDSDDDEETRHYSRLRYAQEDIAHLILGIINYCLTTGHILKRWKTIVNTMIFKDVGIYKIHRLRVIHIYEADFNLLLAVKWRQLLRHADTSHLINPGLFGGRPGCEAQSLPFLEELKYDISYTTRRNLLNFDNDAASCYDRIIVSLASLINRKYGMHRSVVLVHATTLQQARFHLRTQFGFSENSYSHSIHFPIYGSGQGSGNSPSIWLFISSTLCDAHFYAAHGATFVSPDGQENLKITMVGFVDDSTGTNNDFKPQTQVPLPDLIHQMEHDAQMWNDLLWCSGGKLELPKCSFHTLSFQPHPDGSSQPILSIPEDTATLHDALTKTDIPIKSKPADESHKTLGHWKAPADPKQKRQLNILISKARSIATLIHLANVTRYGASLAYHGIYISSLKFVLPQCFLPFNSLKKAEQQTTPLIVAKCGYNRHTAVSLRYAPLHHAGCGFVRWHTLQGEGQITLFLKHWRTNTIISQILRIAISWSQWQSGLSQSILKDTKTPLPHLSSRWLNSLRTFLQHISGSLSLLQPMITPPERSSDIYIMEYAIRSNNFDSNELKIINYCRQYLHITTVSELFDAAGKKLLPHIVKCRRPPWADPNQYIILQHRPSSYQIRHKWLRLLREFSNNDNTPKQCVTFDDWNRSGIRLRSRRESYFCTRSSSLYHWHDHHYWLLSPLPTDTSHFELSHATDWQPHDFDNPVQIQRIPAKHGRSVYSTVNYTCPINQGEPSPTPESQTDQTFHQYLKTAPRLDYYLLKYTSFPICARTTMHEIQRLSQQRIILYEVSDGSMNNQSLSFGWVLGTRDGRKLAWGKGPGYGTDTSHRAEGWGKLAAAKFLYHLSKFTSTSYPDTTRIISYADNKGLISTLQQRLRYTTTYPNITLKPDWDLTEEIYQTFTSSGINDITFSWVKGHQDKAKPIHELSVEAQFNIHADSLATEYMQSNSRHRPISPITNSARCSLTIKRNTIHGHYTEAIRDAASLPELYGYLRRKHQWTKDTFQTISWPWFTRAAKSYTHTDNHLMKLVHDQLPTRYTKCKKTGQSWIPETCRFCELEPETFEHLLKCDHPAGIEFRKSLPRSVRTYCAARGAPHNFQTTLIIAIEDWIRDKPPLQKFYNRPTVKHLATAQALIGWGQFFKGFLTTHWKTFFMAEYSTTNPSDEPFDCDGFFAGLIKVLWTQQSNFWMSHQKNLHSPANQSDDPVRLQELRLEIQQLHTLKGKVSFNLRDRYFPHNMKEFLETSTITQLQTYISTYKPAILGNIATTKQNNSKHKKIHQFPGFTKQRNSTLSPPTSTITDATIPTNTLNSNLQQTNITNYLHKNTTTNPSNPYQRCSTTFTIPNQTTAQTTTSTPPHPHTQRETYPRKHSRWKMFTSMTDRFKSFFIQRPASHTSASTS